MDTETQERLDRLEKRLDQLDAMLARLMTLAAKYPAGRVLLKLMG